MKDLLNGMGYYWVTATDILFRSAGVLKDLYEKLLERATLRFGLHVHQLIAKIPRSRRWRVSQKGLRVIGAAIEFHQVGFFRTGGERRATLQQPASFRSDGALEAAAGDQVRSP